MGSKFAVVKNQDIEGLSGISKVDEGHRGTFASDVMSQGGTSSKPRYNFFNGERYDEPERFSITSKTDM